MTKHESARYAPNRDDRLFPADWPWRAWFVFHGALLASIYEKSGDLWQPLREQAEHVRTWLQHLDYEDELPADGRLESAVPLIPDWPRVEARLEQARNLLGAAEHGTR